MTAVRRAHASKTDSESLESPSYRFSILHALGSYLRRSSLGRARGVVGVFAALLIASNAHAIVIDFSIGTVGNLGTSSATIGGVVVDGFYFDGSDWLSANLFRRNDPDDHGLGICNPEETCTSTTSQGDINELDNAGRDELIRLTLPAGFFWTSVGISSMDDNSGDDEVERGQAFATNDDDPANIHSGTPFWMFAGDGPVELIHPVSGADQFAKYIFFEPIDWSGGGNTNNDYLVWQVSIEPVPEPGTLGLLAAGLLGLVLATRRKKS